MAIWNGNGKEADGIGSGPWNGNGNSPWNGNGNRKEADGIGNGPWNGKGNSPWTPGMGRGKGHQGMGVAHGMGRGSPGADTAHGMGKEALSDLEPSRGSLPGFPPACWDPVPCGASQGSQLPWGLMDGPGVPSPSPTGPQVWLGLTNPKLFRGWPQCATHHRTDVMSCAQPQFPCLL